MDSLTASAAPTHGQNDSPNLKLIRDAFDAAAERGLVAGLETLLEHAREDVGFRPYIASGHLISGHDAIRAFYRAAASAGTEMKLRATSFRDEGDTVVVNGSMRVGRPSGGFSESQISWIYKFQDGLLAEASWCPRRPS